MQAVVLAGGQSTRLRPLTNHRPKMLVPLLNKPIAEHVLERLKEASIEDVIFTVGYRAKQIADYFGDGSSFGMHFSYGFEKHPLGTAGSVKNIADKLEDTFVVASGDIVFDFSLKKAIDTHVEKGSRATILLNTVENTAQFGVVALSKDGTVKSFIEKPNTRNTMAGLVNTGIYILEKKVLQDVPPHKKIDFSLDLFPRLVSKGSLHGVDMGGFWYDIGTFDGLLRAQRDIFLNKTRIEVPGKQVREGIYVQGRAELADPDSVHGPALFGTGVYVGSGTSVRFASVGSGCRIGDSVSILESVIMKDTLVQSEATLTGAILGEGCKVDNFRSVTGPVAFPDRAVV